MCCYRLIAAEKSKEIPSSVILKIVKRDPSFSIVSVLCSVYRKQDHLYLICLVNDNKLTNWNANFTYDSCKMLVLTVRI